MIESNFMVFLLLLFINLFLFPMLINHRLFVVGVNLPEKLDSFLEILFDKPQCSSIIFVF